MKIVNAFFISGYNRRTEDGRLSACFYDHNAYHRRFRDTWLQREKEATRPFTFQPKALEIFENQYKSELLIRSHPRGRGFESLQVHQEKL